MVFVRYSELICHWAQSRCFDSAEAEDLAQEILLQCWLHRERLAGAANPDGYLMGICRNTFRYWVRRKKREPQTVHFGPDAEVFEGLAFEQPDEADEAGEYLRLRRTITNLASQYRELIIGHYYEQKSIKRLSEEAGVPEGTVKWRLMAARQNIMKEWNTMEPDIKLNPAHLQITLSGMPPQCSPVPQMTTAVRSAILLALQNPMSVKELSAVLAIPTMYIEQELAGLLELDTVVRLNGDRCGTDFIIQSADYQQHVLKLAKEYAPPLCRRLLEKMDSAKERLLGIGFERNGTPWEELRYSMLIHAVHDSGILWEGIHEYNPPLRPDGARYYFMCKEAVSETDLFEVHDWYGGIEEGVQYRCCSVGDKGVPGLLAVRMNDVTKWCKTVRDTGSLDGVSPETVARMSLMGLLRNEAGKLALSVPWFTLDQHKAFTEMAKEIAVIMQPELDVFRDRAVSFIENSVSPHLKKHLPMEKVWVGFVLLKEVMRPIWPDDARAVAGLLFVEDK